jgi:hypothetical protein
MKRQTIPKNNRKYQGGFAAWVGAAAGVYGAVEGSKSNTSNGSNNTTGGNGADPFASQRPQYQNQLSTLMANPSSITTSPGYQASLNQGLNAVTATKAAQGLGVSGNEDAALYSYGLTFEQQAFQQQEQDLGQLSGGNMGSTNGAGQINQANNAASSAAWGQLGGLAANGISNAGSGSASFGDWIMGGSM